MNAREVPSVIEGYGPVRAFTGVTPPPEQVLRTATRVAPAVAGRDKLLRDIDAAFECLSDPQRSRRRTLTSS